MTSEEISLDMGQHPLHRVDVLVASWVMAVTWSLVCWMIIVLCSSEESIAWMSSSTERASREWIRLMSAEELTFHLFHQMERRHRSSRVP